MVDVIAAVGSALVVAKQLVEVADGAKNADLKLALANLTEQLAAIKIECARLVDENAALKAKQSVRSSNELQFRDGAYWKPDDPIPYCPACKDSAGKLHRLFKPKPPFDSFGNWQCTVCRQHFS